MTPARDAEFREVVMRAVAVAIERCRAGLDEDVTDAEAMRARAYLRATSDARMYAAVTRAATEVMTELRRRLSL